MVRVEQIRSAVFTSNTYIIHAERYEEVWLVDVGEWDGVIKSIGWHKRIKGVFITHPHYDHIFEINSLIRKFPKCVIFSSESGKEGLFSARLNLSQYHEKPVIFQGSDVHILRENDRIKLFPGCQVEVMETPGHDWSCLTYQIGRYLFTGDSYIPNVEVITKLRGGNKAASKQSLQKIRARITEDIIVCPGHGEMVTAPFIPPQI
jgi:glyoxylase-like metal-dependent hydrolase (beta-lactamase superfamily II)